MGWRRTAVRALAGAYLLVGVGFAAGRGDLALARGWAARTLVGMEEPEPLAIARVERLEARRTAEGRLRFGLEVADPAGRRFAFDLESVDAAPVGDWSTVQVHLGFMHFPVGTPVHAVGADGAVADAPAPLTPEVRAGALLVLLNEGRENRWFLFAHAPPEGGRAPDQAMAAGDLARFALERPITAASRRKRAVLSVVLVPLAFVVDVLTWPVQLVVLLVTLSRIRVH